MLRPFPIVGGAYTDDALPWTHQETINYLPVKAERAGTRSPSKLAMVPGMRVFSDIGDGPHRGAHDVEGKKFVVSGSKLYQITVDGVATEIGTIPGTGRVCMAHNQITGGNQLVIGAGSVGYCYNTYTGVFGQITDDAFPGMIACDFLNQRILGVEPQRRYWFHSALVDATDYNALDEYQAETSPDRIVGLIALHNEVLVFGERTIEPWTNVPTENQAFQLQRGSVIESGCASGNTICKLDQSVFYLTENGQIARLNGYVPQIISTHALEGAIKDCDWSRAFAFTWEDKGHTVYYITFPDGQTWGYDVRQGEWHRRKSFGLERWRLNTLFKSAGLWLGGDFQNGKVYRLDWDYALDGCDPIERIRSSGYVHKDGERARINALQIVMDSGAAQSVKHDGIVITGSMPDTYVGASVSFQYTITTAYPGQEYTLEVSGLPDGLSIDGTGLVTGTPTTVGTFAISLSAVDDCGNESSHADSVEVVEQIMPAQSEWRYLQIADDDATDYSASAFDDSGWATGTAPFGSWEDDSSTSLPAAHTYDARFAAEMATVWGTNTRLWIRRTLTLASVPSGGINLKAYIEDNFHVYVNGALIVTSPLNPSGGNGQVFNVAAPGLVIGDNIIAIRCDDEAPGAGVSVVYVDMLLESE